MNMPPFRHRLPRALLRLVWAAFLLLLAAAHVQAAVEFSTFGPADSFNGSTGTKAMSAAVDGSSTPAGYFSDADQWTASFTGTLSSVEVAVLESNVNSSQFDLSLALTDPTTGLPASLSQVSLGTLTATAGLGSIVSLTPNVSYTFTANTSYWLVLSPHATDSAVGWNVATNPALAHRAYSKDGTTYIADNTNYGSAFRIDAASVPEPGTGVIVATGLIVVAAGAHGAKRRRQTTT